MPPNSTTHKIITDEIMNRYQLARLIRGKARSREPIIIGIRKFPSVVGIDGTRNHQTMRMPWTENALLYIAGSSRIPLGVSRLIRTSAAPHAAITNMNVMLAVYRIAIRLWSRVSSHDRIV